MNAAVLAVLLALPGRADAPAQDDWAPYSKDYARAVVELLGRLPSTREHAKFLLDERIELVVTDSIEHVDDAVIGCYDLAQRRMYIDKVRLLNDVDELQDDGAPREKIAEILAWKTLPTIVHETRHAMTHRALEREFGAWLALPYVESELLSFYDEVLALRDMFRERPKLWAKDKILKNEQSQAVLLRAWERDANGVEALVLGVYVDLASVLTAPRAELLEKAESAARASEDNPKAAALFRASARVLSDEASFARLQDFFRRALRERRKLLRKEKA